MKVARVYADLVQEARCGAQVLARAEIRVACLNQRDFKPAAMPQLLRDKL